MAVTSMFLPTADSDKRAEYYDFTKQDKPFCRTPLVDDLPNAGARLRSIWNTTPIIGIDFHPKIWQGFENIHNPNFAVPGKTKGQLRRLQFGLAITIVHKLAHAAWIYTRTMNGLSLQQQNIHYHLREKEAEFGITWEESVFKAPLNTLGPIPRNLQCFLPAGNEIETATSAKKSDSGSESSSSDTDAGSTPTFDIVFDEESVEFVAGYFPTALVFYRLKSIQTWMVVSDHYISS